MSYYPEEIYENKEIDINEGVNLYVLNAVSDTIKITLPNCFEIDGINIVIYCKNNDKGCIILCYGDQLIDNIGSTIEMSIVGENYNFVSYNSNWYII